MRACSNFLPPFHMSIIVPGSFLVAGRLARDIPGSCRGRGGSGHPTGRATLGQGQGAVVALLVPCQPSSHVPPSPYSSLSLTCVTKYSQLAGSNHRGVEICSRPIVADAGLSTPAVLRSTPAVLSQSRHNSSPLVCHTLWHVGGFPGVCQKAFVGCADVASMPCHTSYTWLACRAIHAFHGAICVLHCSPWCRTCVQCCLVCSCLCHSTFEFSLRYTRF